MVARYSKIIDQNNRYAYNALSEMVVSQYMDIIRREILSKCNFRIAIKAGGGIRDYV